MGAEEKETSPTVPPPKFLQIFMDFTQIEKNKKKC